MKIPFPPRFYLDNDWRFHFDPNPTKAYHANHLSAIFGALTVLFMAFTLNEIVGNDAILLSLRYFPLFLFAFSPLIWEYSVTAEVFALNNVLCSVTLYLTVKIFKLCSESRRQSELESPPQKKLTHFLSLGAFLGGLALSNQHTSLLHIAYLILCIFSFLFYFQIPHRLFLCLQSAMFFLLGLFPYFYLFWASLRNPSGSWGDTSGTLQGLFRHILRSEYGTFRLGGIVGEEDWLQRILLYGKFVSKDSFYVVFPVIFVGVILLMKSSMKGHEKPHFSTINQQKALSGKKNKATEKKTNNNRKNEEIASSFSSSSASLATENDLNSSSSSPSSSITTFPLFFLLFSLWVFYTLVWHCIFSNLPLSAPMPFGVHARFWMQPNIVLFILMGVSVELIERQFFASGSVGNGLGKWRKQFEPVFLIVGLSMLLFHRLPVNNRSVFGWIMHKYGEASLSLIPSQSLLLSHTDIDLNPMRYLRICEGILSNDEQENKEIEHYSIQMMPYPWFSVKQQPHFKSFHLPDVTFPGVSTDRKSEGNKKLITNLLLANEVVPNKKTNNNKKSSSKDSTPHTNPMFPGGVYLDMQSINDAEIGDMNLWNNEEFLLIPWGSQYRVFPHNNKNTNISFIEEYQQISYETIKSFQQKLLFSDQILLNGKENNLFHQLFPIGTWESAVLNIYYDMMNQFGLSLLTYTINQQQAKNNENKLTLERLPIILDRLMVATDCLESSFRDISAIPTISSAAQDLHKNSALAFMRFHALMTVIEQFKAQFVQIYESQRKKVKAKHNLYFSLFDFIFICLSYFE
jgi:hypothetical protein